MNFYDHTPFAFSGKKPLVITLLIFSVLKPVLRWNWTVVDIIHRSKPRILARSGVQVVRICNMDIDQHFREVCEMIDELVYNSLPQSASLTAPSQRGPIEIATTKE